MKKIVLTSSHLTTQQNISTEKLCNNSCRLHVQSHSVNDTIVNDKYHKLIHMYLNQMIFYGYDITLRYIALQSHIIDDISKLVPQISLNRIFVDVNILQRQILLKPIK